MRLSQVIESLTILAREFTQADFPDIDYDEVSMGLEYGVKLKLGPHTLCIPVFVTEAQRIREDGAPKQS